MNRLFFSIEGLKNKSVKWVKSPVDFRGIRQFARPLASKFNVEDATSLDILDIFYSLASSWNGSVVVVKFCLSYHICVKLYWFENIVCLIKILELAVQISQFTL